MARLALPDPPLGDGVITLRGIESSDLPTIVSLAIVDANDGRPLGTSGLHAIDRASACAEIGYMLAAEARARGAASRAVQLLAGWAFGALGLRRLGLHIDRHNNVSRAVAARTGFARVAVPVVQRAETAHFANDVFFARLRDDAPVGG